MSLSPDEQPYDLLELPRRKAAPEQPYWLAAILVGLLAQLLAASVTYGRLQFVVQLAFAVGLALISYTLMTMSRPRIPMMLLTAIAAILGMLYSLPVRAILVSAWRADPQVLADLLTRVVGATIIGVFAGWILAVERYPALVISIAFLFMFVVMSLAQIAH